MFKKAMMLVSAGVMTVATASVASAGVGPQVTGKDACPSSYVCVWDNTNFSGKPKWKSQGNLYNLKSYNGISIFNNGEYYPGGDHIRYMYTYRHSTSPHYKGCLHYPGDSPTTAKSVGVTVILDYAKWGGEC